METLSKIPRLAWTTSLGAMLATLLLVVGPAAAREPWSAPLARGGQVEIDPRTNRPILIQDGRQTQLWDGVHRLEDGSVIRIQEGRVVPTMEMLSPPRLESESEEAGAPKDAGAPKATEQPGAEPISGVSPCEQLVMKVCGTAAECWREPACDAARQLRRMEREDWLGGADPGLITESGKQCREAMGNDFFVPCQ